MMVCSPRETRAKKASAVPTISTNTNTAGAQARSSYEDPASPISSARRPHAVALPPDNNSDTPPATEDDTALVVRNLSDDFDAQTTRNSTIFSSPNMHANEQTPDAGSDDSMDCTNENDASAHHDTTTSSSIPPEEDFDPFEFIRCLPPVPERFRYRPCQLPCKTRTAPRCSLVLDLDETLLHSTITPIPHPDLVIPVTCNDQEFQVYVKKRPHLLKFLEEVCPLFEVIVFTASQKVYAEKLLNILDGERKWIKYRLYREACVEVEGNFVKDLSVLGRDLATTIIVDNSIHAFAYQLDNGVPITSWFDDMEDTELLKLIPLLRRLATEQDVRSVLRDTFKLSEIVRQRGPPRTE